MPPLVIPVGLITLYTTQKFLNNTLYKSYKDLAFVVRKSGKNQKIFQDVMRPDLFSKVIGLDKRQKLGFLQLQALVGMSKIDGLDKTKSQVTIETDSHGIIRKTFQTLSEHGYIQNYEEKFLKKSHLILPKVAFANGELGKKTDIYNMKFQRTEKPIDFEDEEFRKMFPMVFSKRGLLEKQGYTIERNEDGVFEINYTRKGKEHKEAKAVRKNEPLRERIKVELSLNKQRQVVEKFMQKQKGKEKRKEGIDLDKY